MPLAKTLRLRVGAVIDAGLSVKQPRHARTLPKILRPDLARKTKAR
jgi:hypothetical protein